MRSWGDQSRVRRKWPLTREDLDGGRPDPLRGLVMLSEVGSLSTRVRFEKPPGLDAGLDDGFPSGHPPTDESPRGPPPGTAAV